jgi:hypothetical protein
MTATKVELEDQMGMGYFSIPDQKARATMSPERLAILLHEQKLDTPAYVLLQHELNCRISAIQSRATIKAAYLGVVGGIAGSVIGVLVGFVLANATPDSALRWESIFSRGGPVVAPASKPQPAPPPRGQDGLGRAKRAE